MRQFELREEHLQLLNAEKFWIDGSVSDETLVAASALERIGLLEVSSTEEEGFTVLSFQITTTGRHVRLYFTPKNVH